MKRLESLVRPWAIPNLSGKIVMGQVLLFVLIQYDRAQGAGGLLDKIQFDPMLIMQGQVWRVLAFPFVPFDFSIIFAIFGWMIFYSFGSALEHYWGTVRYNIFLGIGVVANVIACFALALLADMNLPASNGFLYSTVFLAFAQLNPDYVIRVYFILPIRIRWLALLMWLGYGFLVLSGPWFVKVTIIASVLNYFLFFGKDHWNQLKHGNRRRRFQAKTREASKTLIHECVVCGLNSETSPRTLFRYCSKCSGQQCYCPEHIHNHEHVIDESEEPESPELADSQSP